MFYQSFVRKSSLRIRVEIVRLVLLIIFNRMPSEASKCVKIGTFQVICIYNNSYPILFATAARHHTLTILFLATYEVPNQFYAHTVVIVLF